MEIPSAAGLSDAAVVRDSQPLVELFFFNKACILQNC